MTDSIAAIRDAASNAKAWPFAEARDLVKRLEAANHDGEVLFETGYGPSGLPHIGTFGEVVRTSMVRHAFEVMTGAKTRLVCFSDDMDGLRKVPDNIPNGEAMQADLGLPLTAVRDPFGTHPSFGAHNNARLQAFLDSFGFDYEFVSSTDCYTSGRFDDGLRAVLAHYDKIMDIMLPTLGEERRATYSPFFPVCPETGRVLQAIRENEFRAEAIGYRVVVYRTLSSVLSALFACVAGAMLALWLRYNGPDTSLSFEIMMDCLLIVVIGGMGSILGGILGAVFMTMVPELLKLIVDLLPGGSELAVFLSPVRTMVFGLLIIVFLVFEPQGLAQMWRRLRRFFHLWPFRN